MSSRHWKKKCRRFCRRLTLSVLGFLIGLLCSVILYVFILLETNIDIRVKYYMLVSMSLFLSIGFAFSRQFRCMVCLMFPEFGSEGGKRAVQASIFILVLSGPLENIGKNSEEVLRFITCTKKQLLEILVTGKDLLLAPIQHIIEDIKGQEDSGSAMNITALSEVVQPILEEVEDRAEVVNIKLESDQVDAEMGNARRSHDLEEIYHPLPGDSQGEKIELMYQKKLAYRCEEIFSKGTEKCKDIFKDKYDACYEAVTWVLGWLLCWPMKLNFICDIVGGFAQNQVCNAAKVVEEGFGETYVAAKKGVSELSDSMKVNLSFPVFEEFSNLDKKMKQHQKDLLDTFRQNRKYVGYIFEMIKRILAPSFLFIVRSAVNYENKYFQTLYYDNIYMTKYFRRIDKRRKDQGKEHLLPLRSFEESDFTSLIRFNLTEPETKKFLVQLIITVVEAGITGTLFLFDYLLTNVLESLNKHGNIVIEQAGIHSLEIRIEGSGFIAELLRKIIKDFSYAKEINQIHDNKQCLPIPHRLSVSYYYRTGILFVVLVIISYIEAHCLRTRHCIANYFFPKRCKKRILWRYNESLKKRRRQISEMKRRIAENVEEKKIRVDFNPIWAFAETFPKCCRCLRYFKFGRRKCILCKKYGEYFRCPDCDYSFCKRCFKNMDKQCLFCVLKGETDSTLRQFTGDSDDSSVV